MSDKTLPISGRKESPRPEGKSPRPEGKSPRPEGNNDNNKSNNNNGIKETSREPIVSSRDKEVMGSARGSARDQNKIQQPQLSARDEPILTNRSIMDTARVHTALAALAAERNVLISKLNYIDSALESEKKKRSSRSIRK